MRRENRQLQQRGDKTIFVVLHKMTGRKIACLLKILLCITMIGGMILSMPVHAAQPYTIELQTEDTVRSGKSFVVSVIFRAETAIGAGLTVLQYDASRLKVTAVTFRNKIQEDVFQYNDTQKGIVKAVFSGSESLRQERVIDIRFQPQQADNTAAYTFTVTEAEACDAYGDTMTATVLPEMVLTVQTKSVTSQTQTVTPQSHAENTSYGEKSTVSFSVSKTSKTVSRSSRTVTADEEEMPADSETAVPTPQTVIIREKDSSPAMTQGAFLALLGIGLMVGVLMFGAFWLGQQKGKKK